MTHKVSWAFLNVCVTSCESFLLTESYSWLPKVLSLGLEVRQPWEHVWNAFWTNCFLIWKEVEILQSFCTVASFVKYSLNKYVKIINSCCTIPRHIPMSIIIKRTKEICKRLTITYERKPYLNTYPSVSFAPNQACFFAWTWHLMLWGVFVWTCS